MVYIDCITYYTIHATYKACFSLLKWEVKRLKGSCSGEFDPRPVGAWSVAFRPLVKFYFLNSVVGGIFDINQQPFHREMRPRLFRRSYIFCLINKTRCVSSCWLLQNATCFPQPKYAILIICNHLLSVRAITPSLLFFSHPVCLVRHCSWALLQSNVNKQLIDLQATSTLALIIIKTGCWWN